MFLFSRVERTASTYLLSVCESAAAKDVRKCSVLMLLILMGIRAEVMCR